MSVVIKSQAKASREYRLKDGDQLKSIMIQPGRNVKDEKEYELLKSHSGFVADIDKDVITINTEGATAKKASAEPDFAYVESLKGTEDCKDVLKEYALAWNIKLNKKHSVARMIEDFKEQYEGK